MDKERVKNAVKTTGVFFSGLANPLIILLFGVIAIALLHGTNVDPAIPALVTLVAVFIAGFFVNR